MNQKRLADALQKKLPGESRTGKESNIWVVIDGRKVLRVTCPKGHSGDVKQGTLKSIRDQMRLGREDLERFVDCKMSRTDYEEYVRGLLTPSVPPQDESKPK